MSYEYLPQEATTENLEPTVSNAQSSFESAVEMIQAKISDEAEAANLEQNVFMLGQLFYEHKKISEAVAEFEKIASTNEGASIFARQAKYQLSILCFDQQVEGHGNAFDELNKLTSTGSNDLFQVCANYNLGLATFNGFNPNIPSGEVLSVAKDYWLKAAGGDVAELSEPKNVKALDIFMPDAQKQLTQQESQLNFYKSMAQCKLGQLYTYDSEMKNEERAFFWHTEAASNGNVESQGVLGVMYLEGIGCRKNEKSGLYCLKAAAGSGDFYALGRLCEYYYKMKLYSHCVTYSKPHAVKFLLDTKANILELVQNSAKKQHCSESFAVKGAVLCAFYFARCVEKNFYRPASPEKDDNDLFLEGVSDITLKLYRACANVEPNLMVELQQMKLTGQI